MGKGFCEVLESTIEEFKRYRIRPVISRCCQLESTIEEFKRIWILLLRLSCLSLESTIEEFKPLQDVIDWMKEVS